MKQLLYIPVKNNYFFRGKTNTATLKRCLNHYVRHFSAVTEVRDTRQVELTKPVSVLKKQKIIYTGKKFSSYSEQSLILMDFDVWLYPKLSRAFRSLYNYFFVLKEMDDTFSVTDFNRSSITALQVVTTLLSELRFSELEGLLTEECKVEVEKNLKYWPKNEVSVLAIKPDKVMRIFPSEVSVFSDEKNGKVFAEIRVIYYVWMKYSSKFEKSDFYSTPLGKKYFNEIANHARLGNIYMCGVFNSKFIKEFTKGVTDQWTINAINMKCYSDLVSI